VAGWIGASLWALYYGVLAVRRNEGTSIAALVRNLLPAVVAVTVVVFADVLGSYAGYAAVVDAVWLVGTVLVGTFLFTTAVAIRQQGGEVERMYDWTTWRGESGLDRQENAAADD
jgi:predicted membrane protein